MILNINTLGIMTLSIKALIKITPGLMILSTVIISILVIGTRCIGSHYEIPQYIHKTTSALKH
jgi:hypothetical protein